MMDYRPVVSAPPRLTELRLAAEPSAWKDGGFRVKGHEVVIGSVRLILEGTDAGRGVVGWSFAEAIPAGALDGLPDPAVRPAPEPGGDHPNGIAAVDHVVALTPDLERTVTALLGAGFDLRRRRGEPTATGQGPQAFFRAGDAVLEVVHHERAADSAATARLWGIALLAPDLDVTASRVGPAIGEVRGAVQPGRRIATFARGAGLGLPVAVLSPRA